MERKWLYLVAALLIVSVVVLALVVRAPGVQTALAAACPWTAILGCCITFGLMVRSGSIWYGTAPWDLSREDPQGAFALGVFTFSLIAMAGFAWTMVHANRAIDLGRDCSAVAVFIVTILCPLTWVALVIGVLTLLAPYLKPPPRPQ